MDQRNGLPTCTAAEALHHGADFLGSAVPIQHDSTECTEPVQQSVGKGRTQHALGQGAPTCDSNGTQEPAQACLAPGRCEHSQVQIALVFGSMLNACTHPPIVACLCVLAGHTQAVTLAADARGCAWFVACCVELYCPPGLGDRPPVPCTWSVRQFEGLLFGFLALRLEVLIPVKNAAGLVTILCTCMLPAWGVDLT